MEQLPICVLKLFMYSWQDVSYDYNKLTLDEQSCISPEEFAEVRSQIEKSENLPEIHQINKKCESSPETKVMTITDIILDEMRNLCKLLSRAFKIWLNDESATRLVRRTKKREIIL